MHGRASYQVNALGVALRPGCLLAYCCPVGSYLFCASALIVAVMEWTTGGGRYLYDRSWRTRNRLVFRITHLHGGHTTATHGWPKKLTAILQQMPLVSQIHIFNTVSSLQESLTHLLANPTFPNHRDVLLIPKGRHLEWQLWPFVFFPNHHRRSGLRPPYFPPVLRKGEVKLPHKCDQECVQLNDAVRNKQSTSSFSIRPHSGVFRLTQIATQCNSWDLQRT